MALALFRVRVAGALTAVQVISLSDIFISPLEDMFVLSYRLQSPCG